MFILQLGRVEALCLYELQQLLPQAEITSICRHFYLVNQVTQAELLTACSQSGGIIKALTILQSTPTTTQINPDRLTPIITKLATKSFHVFSPQLALPSELEEQIKSALKDQGVASRFARGNKQLGLSAAVLLHKRITELGIFTHDQQTLIAHTIWSQDIDHWTVKDRQRPRVNRKRGMIPPKLARQMINLLSPNIRNQTEKVLYDPFCGEGTILVEGLELGWRVVGSDISQSAIEDSHQNLTWFTKLQQLDGDLFQVLLSDATQVKPNQIPRIDAIVSEPFLGKQLPDPKKLINIFTGLEKLYLGSFKNWRKLLKDGAEIVIVTPLVITPKKVFSLAHLIDDLAKIGYTTISGPLEYSRPDAQVKRAIYHLRFSSLPSGEPAKSAN